MTVTITTQSKLVVPQSLLQKAGFKLGDQLEFKVSRGLIVIGIMGADELEDYLEIKDARVNAQIRESNRDVKAGKVRPAEELIKELTVSSSKPSRIRK